MNKNKNLNKATINLHPASPVELIMGWYDFIMALFAITLLAGTIAFRRTGENLATTISVTAFMLLFMWLPGMIMSMIVSEGRDRLAKISSTYASAQSIFSCGIKQAFRRCTSLPISSISGISVYLALFLTTAIMIGNIGAVFYADAWLLSLISGAILSFGGFCVIGLCILRDFLRETRLKRQLL